MSEVRKFRKKPVVIEAMQFTKETKDRAYNWVTGMKSAVHVDGEPALKIGTLEGDHLARLGDWIIKGVKGEFYPCKNDIFKLTYEEVLEYKKIVISNDDWIIKGVNGEIYSVNNDMFEKTYKEVV